MDFSEGFNVNEINEFINSDERDCVLYYRDGDVNSINVLIDGFFNYFEKYKDTGRFVSPNIRMIIGMIVSKGDISRDNILYFDNYLKNNISSNIEYGDNYRYFLYDEKYIWFKFISKANRKACPTFHEYEINYLAFDNKQNFDIYTYDLFRGVSRAHPGGANPIIRSTYKIYWHKFV